MSIGIIEITELSLKSGVTDAQFLATTRDVNAEVAKLRGFRSRRLLKSADGWIEVIEWDDMDCAREAGEKWGDLPGIRDYCSMVAYDTVKANYHPVLSSIAA